MQGLIGRINPKEKQVTIWGAGFSGLVLGHYLKQQGFKITIYEKSNRVGGKIQTIKTSSGPAESAANALYLNQDGLELLKELNLEPMVATPKLKRLIMVNGRPKRPFQIELFSRVIANVYKKPPLISDGLTVGDFFRPLLGPSNIKQYLSPALGGLYATPADQLHFKAVFPQAAKQAQFDSYWGFIKMIIKNIKTQPKQEISGSVSFEGGMQTLINRLAQELKANIKLNYKEKFRIKGNTIICTDAHSAAELLKDLRPEMSEELGRIRYQKLSSSTVFVKREIKGLNKAFGVLIPQDNGYHAIGILNNKAIFPANNKNIQSYTLISPNKLSDEHILEDLKRLNSDYSQEDIEYIEKNYWERALPVYDLQLYLAIKKLHQLGQSESELAIFGNYVCGISLRDMITAAKNFSLQTQERSEAL
jgi:protoporphyrinogen oxidase